MDNEINGEKNDMLQMSNEWHYRYNNPTRVNIDQMQLTFKNL